MTIRLEFPRLLAQELEVILALQNCGTSRLFAVINKERLLLQGFAVYTRFRSVERRLLLRNLIGDDILNSHIDLIVASVHQITSTIKMTRTVLGKYVDRKCILGYYGLGLEFAISGTQ